MRSTTKGSKVSTTKDSKVSSLRASLRVLRGALICFVCVVVPLAAQNPPQGQRGATGATGATGASGGTGQRGGSGRGGGGGRGSIQTMTLTTMAWKDGAEIPAKYTQAR